jgi:hypothetical protein
MMDYTDLARLGTGTNIVTDVTAAQPACGLRLRVGDLL